MQSKYFLSARDCGNMNIQNLKNVKMHNKYTVRIIAIDLTHVPETLFEQKKR